MRIVFVSTHRFPLLFYYYILHRLGGLRTYFVNRSAFSMSDACYLVRNREIETRSRLPSTGLCPPDALASLLYDFTESPGLLSNGETPVYRHKYGYQVDNDASFSVTWSGVIITHYRFQFPHFA